MEETEINAKSLKDQLKINELELNAAVMRIKELESQIAKMKDELENKIKIITTEKDIVAKLDHEKDKLLVSKINLLFQIFIVNQNFGVW